MTDGTTPTTISVALNELDVVEAPAPAFTGTNSTSGGNPSYAFNYNENQAAGATLGTVATSGGNGGALSYSITGGNTNGWYAINSTTGAITITAAGAASLANNFEAAPNLQTLTVQVTDGTTPIPIQVALNELDVVEAPILITVPGNAPGAPSAGFQVKEGQSTVVTLSSAQIVSWSIASGEDRQRFKIDPVTGALALVEAPDFEKPADGAIAGSNTYLVVVEALDAAGNVSTVTITVTVTDVDEAGPKISASGATGSAGNAQITVVEGSTKITTMTADEAVTWKIVGGEDQALFALSPTTGILTFLNAPDFEAPKDRDGNNSYLVEVTAVDSAGNLSRLFVTVLVINSDEIGQKLSSIAAPLRDTLRSHAVQGLSDMLSYNEGLLSGGADPLCLPDQKKKPFLAAASGDDDQTNANLNFSDRLDGCNKHRRVYLDGGVAFSERNGDWTTRGLVSLRAEQDLTNNITVGATILGTFADNNLSGFEGASISDRTIQGSLYGRTYLSRNLKAAVFAGYGVAWYDLDLDDDGLKLQGNFSGKRLVYGGILTGDIKASGPKITTDIHVSRAEETLGNARLAAQFQGEKRDGINFALGNIQVTRLFVPLRIAFTLADLGWGAPNTRIELAPGFVCQGSSGSAEGLDCGIKAEARLSALTGLYGRAYLDASFEQADDVRRFHVGAGYMRRFGVRNGFQAGLSARSGLVNSRLDNRILLKIDLAR